MRKGRIAVTLLLVLGVAYVLFSQREPDTDTPGGNAIPSAGSSAPAELQGMGAAPLVATGDEAAAAANDKDVEHGPRSAEVAVRVVDEDGDPVPGVQVLLIPAPAASGVKNTVALEETTDGQGSVVLTVTQSSYPIGIVVLEDGWRIGSHWIPEPTAQVTVSILHSFTSRILVRDHLGAAVEGAEVQFTQQVGPTQAPAPASTARVTDARGVAVLPVRLRQSLVGHLDVKPAAAGDTSFEKLHVKHWLPQEEALITVVRMATVTGRVVSSEGEAAPRASLFVRTGPGSYEIHRSDAAGRFELRKRAGVEIGLAPAPRSSLTAPPSAAFRRVRPPSDNVVLELPAVGQLRVLLEGTRAGASYECALIIESAGVKHLLQTRDSAFEFDGVDPDTVYSLWVTGTGGAYARARDVSGRVGEIRLTVQQGVDLEADFKAPESWMVRAVSIFDAGVLVQAVQRKRGRFALQGVPPGTLRVTVLLASETGYRRVEITTDDIRSATGPIQLVLEDSKEAAK